MSKPAFVKEQDQCIRAVADTQGGAVLADMSVKQYAEHRGVQIRSINYALQKGHIRRNDAGWIDSEQADRDWEKNVNPRSSAANKRNGAIGQALRRRREESGQARPPRPEFAPPPLPPEDSAPAAQPPADIEAFAKARAVRERFAALMIKLDYEEKSGKLISRAEVETAAFTRDRILRDLVLAIPDRIAAQLAAETNPALVHEALEAELRAVLDKVASMKTLAPSRRGAQGGVAYGNAG